VEIICFRVEPETKRRLVKIARYRKLEMSVILRQIIGDWLKENDPFK